MIGWAKCREGELYSNLNLCELNVSEIANQAVIIKLNNIRFLLPDSKQISFI